MPQRLLRGVAVLATLGVGFAGGWWSAQRGTPATADHSAVVVRHGPVEVTAAEVAAALEEEGPFGAAGPDQADRRNVASRLLREKVLADRARQVGLHQEPAVASRVERVLAEAYVQRELAVGAVPPTEEQLKAYFEASQAELGAPARMRVAHIFLAAPEGAPHREARRAAAAALAKEAEQRTAKDFYAFGTLARTRSEADSRQFGGELPWLGHPQLQEKFGEEAVRALEQLAPGAVLGAPVERSDGFHVLRLVARDPGSNPRYEDVQQMLRTRWRSEKQEKKRKELMSGIENSPQTVWEDDELAAAR